MYVLRMKWRARDNECNENIIATKKKRTHTQSENQSRSLNFAFYDYVCNKKANVYREIPNNIMSIV